MSRDIIHLIELHREGLLTSDLEADSTLRGPILVIIPRVFSGDGMVLKEMEGLRRWWSLLVV